MVDTAGRGSFDGWYRSEHPRVLALLTVAAGDPDLGREVTSEAFVRALERSATLISARGRLAVALEPVEVHRD